MKHKVTTLLLLILTGCSDTTGGKGEEPTNDDTGNTVIVDTGDPRTVTGEQLCAGSALSTDGTYTTASCLSPAALGDGSESFDGTHTLQSGGSFVIAP